MGIVKNIWIMAKGVGRHRALTRADLFDYCEPLLKQPAAPAELLDAMHDSFVRFEGRAITIIEYYRHQSLTPALERIAAEPTWDRQRARCLREMLNDVHWSNWQHVFRRAETEWGKGIILGKLRTVWPKASDAELEYYLLQNFMIAICTGAALTTVAQTFYGLTKTKELEIKLFEQYGRDIDLLDTSIMDLWFNNHADDLDTADALATWKDERLNPTLREMYQHLTATKDQIIEDVFDVSRFKTASARLDQKKAELAQELLTA